MMVLLLFLSLFSGQPLLTATNQFPEGGCLIGVQLCYYWVILRDCGQSFFHMVKQ